MSEQWQGPGWWQASDGKWYPPESAPAATPPTPPAGAPFDPNQQYAPYQPYGQTAAPPASGANGLAIASLVLGVLGIVTFCIWGLGAVFGLLAVVFGALAIRNAKKQPGTPQVGLAWAGLICGIVAVVAGVVVFVLLVLAVATSDDIDSDGGINSDPSDGICNEDRFLQDPDC